MLGFISVLFAWAEKVFQGDGKAAFGIAKYRMKRRYRGTGRAPSFTIPRLALWAGVGVFIGDLHAYLTGGETRNAE